MTVETQREVPSRVECPAARDPAVRMFIFAFILIGFGVWCFYDAYVLGRYGLTDNMDVNAWAGFLLNRVGGIALPLVGLIPLAIGIAQLRRSLVADAEGIGYVGKAKIPWSAVRALGSEQLASKGVLQLRYDAGGQEKVLTLDGWKLQNFRDLVLLLESKVAPADGSAADEEAGDTADKA